MMDVDHILYGLKLLLCAEDDGREVGCRESGRFASVISRVRLFSRPFLCQRTRREKERENDGRANVEKEVK